MCVLNVALLFLVWALRDDVEVVPNQQPGEGMSLGSWNRLTSWVAE